jgi:hypothetical protein
MVSGAEKDDQFDPDSLPVVSSQLKRRLTTHNDLMSVLSVSAHILRLITRKLIEQIFNCGVCQSAFVGANTPVRPGASVIPVLLTCVLSRSDSAIAAGLFRPSLDPEDDVNSHHPKAHRANLQLWRVPVGFCWCEYSGSTGCFCSELSGDETKYMRELKTLVGGVIPVLLTCVLSRSDSEAMHPRYPAGFACAGS